MEVVGGGESPGLLEVNQAGVPEILQEAKDPLAVGEPSLGFGESLSEFGKGDDQVGQGIPWAEVKNQVE